MTPRTIQPQVTIRNLGAAPQSDIPVRITIDRDGTEVYSAEAVHPGPLVSQATANISFTPDWVTPEGQFLVTSWTLLAGDDDPTNDTVRTIVLVSELLEDTLHWDGENNSAVGYNDGGPFFGAVRFTPAERYTLTDVLWYNRNAAHTAQIRIYGHLFENTPGDLLATLDSPVGDNTWISVPTPALVMPPGRDFWVAVRLTYPRNAPPLGIDAGLLVPMRNFMSTHGTGWQEVSRIGLYYNWNIRAVVQLGGSSGIESEKPATGRPHFRLGPNPTRGRPVTLYYNLPQAGPAQVTVSDVTGRRMLSRPLTGNRQSATALDLHGLASGVYIVELESGAYSVRQKLVLQP